MVCTICKRQTVIVSILCWPDHDPNYKGPKYLTITNHRVFRVSMLGIVIIVLCRYLAFGYVGP